MSTVAVYAERVRRNQEAFFRQYLPYSQRHDVTLRGGVLLGRTVAGGELIVDASWGRRLNYLFQNTQHIQGYRTMNVSVPRLTVRFVPNAFGALWQRRPSATTR